MIGCWAHMRYNLPFLLALPLSLWLASKGAIASDLHLSMSHACLHILYLDSYGVHDAFIDMGLPIAIEAGEIKSQPLSENDLPLAVQVKPTLARLKTTLLATGAGLLVSGLLLVGSIAAGRDADSLYSALPLN